MSKEAESRRVKALVATLIDSYQIALNVGSDSGVRKDANVVLYRVISVSDPVSGDELGKVRLPKVRLRVNHVQANLCVARVTDRQEKDANPFSLVTGPAPLIKLVEAPRSTAGAGEVAVTIGEEALLIVPPPSADAEQSD